MKVFFINQSTIGVIRNDGSQFNIFLNSDSGKIFYRYKIDSISKIKHPGIYLGTDINGNHYFIHNHYEVGFASIASLAEFSKGRKLYLDETKCLNPQTEILRIAIGYVNDRIRYSLINDNCQTLTNDACHNRKRSESVNNWVGGLALVALFALIVKAAS
jgi:hypothetical protein